MTSADGGPMLYLNCFFVTVATILGTGILGLPVKTSGSGITPFLAVFSICLVMQLTVVYLMVDILQAAKVRLIAEADPAAVSTVSSTAAAAASASASAGDSSASSNSNKGQYMELDDEGGGGGGGGGGRSAVGSPRAGISSAGRRAIAIASPDLHTMGHMFLLSPSSRLLFDASVLFHFFFVLTSYTLAGSEAWGQLLRVDFRLVITPFLAAFTIFVVFGSKYIAPFIAWLTAVKCSLLVVMIAVVGVVASKIDAGPTSDWEAVMEPFLIGTVALGGVVNILPVLFAKIPFNPPSIRRFRTAVTLGVVACWILNVFWAYFVLRIVPQTRAKAAAETDDELAGLGVSLEQAADDGEISTVPVIRVIEADFPKYDWVAKFVTIFIMLSVSVSFVTLATGMVHVLKGIVLQWQKSHSSAVVRQAPSLLSSPAGSTGQRRHLHADSPRRGAGQGGDDAWSGHALRALDVDLELSGGLTPELDPDAAAGQPGPNDLSLGIEGMRGDGEGGGAHEAKKDVFAEVEGYAGSAPVPTFAPTVHHTVALAPHRRSWVYKAFPWAYRPTAQQGVLYAISFGAIWLFAMANPSGFFLVLEVLTSLALNLEAGLFVALMWRTAMASTVKAAVSPQQQTQQQQQQQQDGVPPTRMLEMQTLSSRPYRDTPTPPTTPVRSDSPSDTDKYGDGSMGTPLQPPPPSFLGPSAGRFAFQMPSPDPQALLPTTYSSADLVVPPYQDGTQSSPSPVRTSTFVRTVSVTVVSRMPAPLTQGTGTLCLVVCMSSFLAAVVFDVLQAAYNFLGGYSGLLLAAFWLSAAVWLLFLLPSVAATSVEWYESYEQQRVRELRTGACVLAAFRPGSKRWRLPALILTSACGALVSSSYHECATRTDVALVGLGVVVYVMSHTSRHLICPNALLPAFCLAVASVVLLAAGALTMSAADGCTLGPWLAVAAVLSSVLELVNHALVLRWR